MLANKTKSGLLQLTTFFFLLYVAGGLDEDGPEVKVQAYNFSILFRSLSDKKHRFTKSDNFTEPTVTRNYYDMNDTYYIYKMWVKMSDISKTIVSPLSCARGSPPQPHPVSLRWRCRQLPPGMDFMKQCSGQVAGLSFRILQKYSVLG